MKCVEKIVDCYPRLSPWSMYCCIACLGCTDCSVMCACLPAFCCWRWIVWCVRVSCIDSDVMFILGLNCEVLWASLVGLGTIQVLRIIIIKIQAHKMLKRRLFTMTIQNVLIVGVIPLYKRQKYSWRAEMKMYLSSCGVANKAVRQLKPDPAARASASSCQSVTSTLCSRRWSNFSDSVHTVIWWITIV